MLIVDGPIQRIALPVAAFSKAGGPSQSQSEAVVNITFKTAEDAPDGVTVNVSMDAARALRDGLNAMLPSA